MKAKLLFIVLLGLSIIGASSMTGAQDCQGCHTVQASFDEPSVVFVQDVMPGEETAPGWLNWMLIVVSFVVAGANAITVSLPSYVQGSRTYNMVMKLLNFLAVNLGRNKNSDDKTLDEANRPPASLK